MKSLQLGIFGLGTVGSGTMDILTTNARLIENQIGQSLTIKTVCVRDTGKTRSIDTGTTIMTSNINDILDDPEIDIIVELIGGTNISKSIIESAFIRGKHVVTANKDLIALYGKELTQLAKKNNCQFLFEAAVAGAIPILHSLQFSLMANKIQKIGGIVNGSTNYILTRMEVEKLSLEQIIEDAMKLGYLEADPSSDLEGLDAARKCAILASIGFHNLVTSNQVYSSGINNISLEDIKYAKKLGYKIKLLAIAENREDSVVARVHPALLPISHPLAGVSYEFNAVYVNGDKLGSTMFYGSGAGSLPTGSAVVNDIIQIAKNIVFNNKFEYAYEIQENKKIADIKDLSFPYYLKIQANHDLAGTSQIIDIFSKNGLEINSIDKHEIKEKGENIKKYVIVINECKESQFDIAVDEIKQASYVIENIIRIENKL